MHTYKEFIERIQLGERFPKPQYFEYLVKFKDDILQDTLYRKQMDIAKDLKISQSQLSLIIKLLTAVNNVLPNPEQNK